MEPTPIQRPTMGPETCPTCRQKTHPGGTCPGFGPSDSDQLTAARLEIDELRSEVAKLLSDLRASTYNHQEAKRDRDECRQVIRDIYCKLGLDQLAKVIASAEAQMQEARIPF